MLSQVWGMETSEAKAAHRFGKATSRTIETLKLLGVPEIRCEESTEIFRQKTSLIYPYLGFRRNHKDPLAVAHFMLVAIYRFLRVGEWNFTTAG